MSCHPTCASRESLLTEYTRTMESIAADLLVPWAERAMEKSLNQAAKPHIIVVVNTVDIDLEESGWDTDVVTSQHLERLDKLSISNNRALKKIARMIAAQTRCGCAHLWDTTFVISGLHQFSDNLDEPFDLLAEAWRGIRELKGMVGGLLHFICTFRRASKRGPDATNAVKLLTALAPVFSSCLLLDAERHNLLGMSPPARSSTKRQVANTSSGVVR